MFGTSKSFRELTPALRADIERDTIAIAETLARPPSRQRGGRLSQGLAGEPPPPPRAIGTEAGTRGAGQMIREVDFVQFVTELVKGVFQSIVQSSMDQMKAYGELVRSVAMSLNEFRDANVDEKQGEQHLAQRYPSVFQMNVGGDAPGLLVREDADMSTLPDFQGDFGLEEEVTDLDEETVRQRLLPAARDSVARGRQKLLATMVLMGINRIVVTNGKINAKVRFDFKAHDFMTNTTVEQDREHLGDVTLRQGYVENAGTALARDTYQQYTQPVIKVASQSTTTTTGEVDTSGYLFGEVSLNFKSETFPLEKMVDTNQMTRLENAQRGGAPPGAAARAPAPAAAPAAPAPPATAPTS